ncbi:MAG: sensor histidine kinase [Acidimicrobiales bacterium]
MTRRGVIPASLAGLVAVGSIVGFIEGRRVADSRSRPAVQAVAFAHATAVNAELESDAARLRTAAEALGFEPTHAADLSAFATGNSSEAIGVARGTGFTFIPIVESTNAAVAALNRSDLGDRPEWRLALELARDGGSVTAAATTGATGTEIVLQAEAMYGTPNVPTGVDGRRRDVLGYVVLIEPAASLVAPSTPGLENNVAVRVAQDSVVLGSTSRSNPSKTMSRASITADGVSWNVQAWSVQQHSQLPLLRLLLGLLVAAVVGCVAAVGEHRSEELAREAVARANELGLVARTGALLQETLELAELVPLFVVEVSDQLGLASVAISVLSESGELVRAFSMGLDTPASIPSEPLPSSVAAGAAFHIPLQRGGRVIGVLTATATRGLQDSQMEALRAVCDLLAAALGNARLFQEEQDMVAQLRDLDSQKATFLGSVSHELRTTVIAIEGFAGLLATTSGTLDEAQRADFAERIRRNARSLGLLIEDLLDSARLERLGIGGPLEPVSLTDLVPKVVDQMSSLLGQRPVFTSIAPDVVALAEPAAVERILVNLLSNAAKYTPEGTEVMVSVASDDQSATLCVADRGPGIAAADRERIFDRFFRVDNETARTTRGVGIGLALAKQYADQLHATIVADETPGGGARFSVSIPLADQALRAEMHHLTQPAGLS